MLNHGLSYQVEVPAGAFLRPTRWNRLMVPEFYQQ